MAVLNVYRDNLSEYTVLSNYFIDYYMEDANEAQLQVYLYLLRMVSANLPVSVADIVEKFKHSEKEVLRALKYWELQKLITLEMDGKKNVTGIHFHAIPAPVTATEPTAVAPVISEQTADTCTTAVSQPEETDKTPSIYIKPAYTMKQLGTFKKQDAAAQLIYVAEAYVGKPLSQNDLATIYFMWDVLHFSDDLIDYLIQYCVEREKRDFRYMETVAIRWAEQGITTPQQAKLYASQYDKPVYTIMNALGKSGNNPAPAELEYINRWTNEYGFDMDIILEACKRSVLSTDQNRFNYTEGILNSWRQAKVNTTADIEKLDAEYKKKASAAQKPKNTNTTANRFNQFKQNAYDFAALEEELLSN